MVSVVVPAFNAAQTLGGTLRSLVEQSYANLEIVVVDDGSTDATLSVAEEMARCHPQVRVIRQSNRGVAAARNHGVRVSRGTFVAPVDADDLWFPDAAEKLASCLLHADPRVGVAYGWSVTVDENESLDGGLRCSMIQGEVSRALLCHNFIGNASASMIRRTCFEEAGGYDGGFREQGVQGCEDWDLYLRISESHHFGVVPEFLVGYRRSGGSMSSDASSMSRSHEHLLRETRRRHSGIPGALYRLSTSSFHLHLARECHRQGMTTDSGRWLRQAFVKGLPWTLLRPAFYTLATRNALATLGVGSTASTGEPRGEAPQASLSGPPDGWQAQIGNVARRRSLIRWRIAAQDILHRVVSQRRTI